MGSGCVGVLVVESLPAFFAEVFFALAGARRGAFSTRPFTSAAAAAEAVSVSLGVLDFLGTANSEWCIGLAVPARFASSFSYLPLSMGNASTAGAVLLPGLANAPSVIR